MKMGIVKRKKRKRGTNPSASITNPPASPSSSTPTTTSTTSLLPVDPTQWGLDPLYWSYVRLTCYQISSLQTLPSLEHAHVLNQLHSLSKVQVVGVVVRVVVGENFHKYTLDDGTGMVDVMHWKSDHVKKMAISPPSFDHGATLCVRGKLKMYTSEELFKYLCFGIRQITVQNISIVQSIHEEIHHRLHCIKLQRQFYSGNDTHRNEATNSASSSFSASSTSSFSSSSSSSSFSSSSSSSSILTPTCELMLSLIERNEESGISEIILRQTICSSSSTKSKTTNAEFTLALDSLIRAGSIFVEAGMVTQINFSATIEPCLIGLISSNKKITENQMFIKISNGSIGKKIKYVPRRVLHAALYGLVERQIICEKDGTFFMKQ